MVILLLQGLLLWVSLKDIVWSSSSDDGGGDNDDDDEDDEDLRWWYVLAAFLGSFAVALSSLVWSVLRKAKATAAIITSSSSSSPSPSPSSYSSNALLAPSGGASTHDHSNTNNGDNGDNGDGVDDAGVGDVDGNGERRSGRERGDSGARAAVKELMLQYGMPSLFLFVYNAVPSASSQLYTYTFYLFYADSPCKVTQLNLISSFASVLSFVAYGALCNRGGIRRVIVSTSVVAVLLGLLWLPLASLDLDSDDDGNDGGNDDAPSATTTSYDEGSYGYYNYYYYFDSSPVLQGQCVTWGSSTSSSGCMDPFAYAAVVQFVTSLTGMLAFTPNTVLATEATPAEYKTTAYAVFLSLIDSGDTASGWISAAIVSSLGLSFDSWVRLPEFIWVASACQLAALALVPFLRDAKPLASLYLDDAAAETEPELEPPRRTTESGAVGRSDGEDPLLAHEHR